MPGSVLSTLYPKKSLTPHNIPMRKVQITLILQMKKQRIVICPRSHSLYRAEMGFELRSNPLHTLSS